MEDMNLERVRAADGVRQGVNWVHGRKLLLQEKRGAVTWLLLGLCETWRQNL